MDKQELFILIMVRTYQNERLYMSSASGPRVVFAHGKESGPWGSKITHLAAIAQRLGYAVESPDYSGMNDAPARVDQLLERAPVGAPLVLCGSSMGGYVCAMACQALRPTGLLLLAPALYLRGYPGEPQGCPQDTAVVHGWHDYLVPCEQSLRFARPRGAALHLVNDGHRLVESLDLIGVVFERLLQRALSR